LCRPFGAPRGNDGAPGWAWRRGGRLPPQTPAQARVYAALGDVPARCTRGPRWYRVLEDA
jgi:hypothetical protein